MTSETIYHNILCICRLTPLSGRVLDLKATLFTDILACQAGEKGMVKKKILGKCR
jgi:hypothetical protein